MLDQPEVKVPIGEGASALTETARSRGVQRCGRQTKEPSPDTMQSGAICGTDSHLELHASHASMDPRCGGDLVYELSFSRRRPSNTLADASSADKWLPLWQARRMDTLTPAILLVVDGG
jgi:hypothetical protein